MHASYGNLSSDHVPAGSEGRRYFFVGDGDEVLFCDSRESTCADEAVRLNRESESTRHNVYCVDVNETVPDDSSPEGVAWAYPAERALAIQEFGE